MLKVIDLFSGAGGISCGLRQVRDHNGEPLFETVQAIEIDRDAAASFGVNFPSAEVLNCDIREVVGNDQLKNCDVVVGGPPCQGFSQLGKGDPQGIYNDLWRAYVTALVESTPRYFIMENVPQFASSMERHFFEAELDSGLLKDYTIEPIRTLNSADYGVPQNRKRMVILGTRKGEPILNYPGVTTPDPLTVGDVFADIVPSVNETALPKRFHEIAGFTRPGPFESWELHLTRKYQPRSLERFSHIRVPGGNRFDLPDRLQPNCWLSHRTGATDVMGRLHLDRPSVTIRTEFFKPEKGRYLHPTEDRAITHFEAVKLMGFPDDYQWVGSKTSIAKQIGNAVPPPMMSALGEELISTLGRKPPVSD